MSSDRQFIQAMIDLIRRFTPKQQLWFRWECVSTGPLMFSGFGGELCADGTDGMPLTLTAAASHCEWKPEYKAAVLYKSRQRFDSRPDRNRTGNTIMAISKEKIGRAPAFSFADNREKVLSLLDSIPDYKMGYVLAYMQGIVADEEADDVFCQKMFENYENDPDPEKDRAYTLEECKQEWGLA